MKALKGVEKNFVQLRSNFSSLISFWCAHEISLCIEDRVSFVKNHIFFCRFSTFLVYFLYTVVFWAKHY